MNTSRLIGDESCHLVKMGVTPEATVNKPTPTPTAMTATAGLIGGRCMTARTLAGSYDTSVAAAMGREVGASALPVRRPEEAQWEPERSTSLGPSKGGRGGTQLATGGG